MENSIKVALDASKGIAVHATGAPARIVAVGAAAGVVFLSVAVGYGIFETTRWGIKRLQARGQKDALPGPTDPASALGLGSRAPAGRADPTTDS